MYVLPLIIWSGLSMAFFAGVFIPLMTRTMKDSMDINPDLDTDDKRSVAALFTFILLGVGEILGGIMFVGPIRDKYGNRIAYIVQMILTALAVANVLYYNNQDTYNWAAYSMCFFWGIQDSGINCLINCMLGFEFDDKTTPFGVFKFVQSLAIFGFSNVSSAVMSSNNSVGDQKKYILIYLLSAGIFGFLSMIAMLFFDFKPEETKDDKFNELS